jgi:tetratricopeptide (TPR) repeat protein
MRGALLGLGVAVMMAGCASQSAIAPEVEVATDLSQRPTSKTKSATDLEAGLKLYSERRYVEAAEAFERAYKRGGSTPALFAEGQSLQMAGDCTRALEVFERLLTVEPDPTYAYVVRDLMEECQ